jgi:hypothetical protein
MENKPSTTADTQPKQKNNKNFESSKRKSPITQKTLWHRSKHRFTSLFSPPELSRPDSKNTIPHGKNCEPAANPDGCTNRTGKER